MLPVTVTQCDEPPNKGGMPTATSRNSGRGDWAWEDFIGKGDSSSETQRLQNI